jgi:hypothetical protein
LAFSEVRRQKLGQAGGERTEGSNNQIIRMLIIASITFISFRMPVALLGVILWKVYTSYHYGGWERTPYFLFVNAWIYFS